jgi:hypothetical protein
VSGFIYMTCTMPMPSHTTTVVCPPLIEISADVQKRAREELLQLPRTQGFVASLRARLSNATLCGDVKSRKRKDGEVWAVWIT